jgi:hypothetical protein
MFKKINKKMKYSKKENICKTFEGFIGNNSKWDKYSNLSKPQEGEVDLTTKNKILDVENFNNWLRNDFSGYGYSSGASQLVGNVNKLSYAMIVSYFLNQGVECNDNEITNFQNKIKSNWNETH